MFMSEEPLSVPASLVGRVRRLLEDLDKTKSYPGDSAARARVAMAQRYGTASRDLAEVEDRLRILRERFPEIDGVEIGRGVGEARDFFEDRTLWRPAFAGSDVERGRAE